MKLSLSASPPLWSLALLMGGTLVGLGSSAQAQGFSYSGSVVTYTVPKSGLYDITAIGGDGGPSYFSSGGNAVSISGDIYLMAGTTYDIVVGGAGATGAINDLYGGGGGGGSYVFAPGATEPLIVAGGGGGAGYFFGVGVNGGHGQTGTAGQNGFGPNGGAGGTNGSGGGGGTSGIYDGGGAAGWFSNGTDGAGGAGALTGGGGFGPPTFAGGAGASNGIPSPVGGFGGGGGGGFQGGGGGGGYSGGGGGDGGNGNGGGGGGSYYDPAFTNVTFGANGLGNGSVTFRNAAVPELSTNIILGSLCLAGTGFLRRRRAR